MIFPSHLAKGVLLKASVVDAGDECLDGTDAVKELRIRNRQLFALLELSQTLAKTSEPEIILNAALDKSMETLGFDVGYIRTLDNEGKNLIVPVARGLSSPEFLTTAFSLDSSAPIVGKKVFKEKRPHVSADIRKDPEFRARTMEREGLVSVAMVPIMSKENVLGFIALGNKRSHDFSGVELGLISNFSSQLGTALENAQLFSKVRAQAADLDRGMHERLFAVEQLERLKLFVSPHLAEMILVGGPEDPLKARRREVTAVFAGLRGFKAFAARSEPEEVMNVLRQFHFEMGALIRKYGGTLEHFSAERVMILFNAPIAITDPAERAVRMAWAMREQVKALSEEWCNLGFDLSFCAGIAHGYATLGSIGFEGRMDYAAVGRVPNLASCLCDRANNNQILISHGVRGLTQDVVRSEPIDALTFDGLPAPVKAHLILHVKDSPNI